MFASYELECAVLDAIASHIGEPGVVLQGAWQPIDETPDAVAIVTVAVATPTVTTYTSPHHTFDGSVTLATRLELDPRSDKLRALAEALCQLFDSWQAQTYQEGFAALDIDKDGVVLHVDEISVEGAAPQYDRDAGIRSVTFALTLQASIVPKPITTTGD